MKVGAEWREDLKALSPDEWKKLFGQDHHDMRQATGIDQCQTRVMPD